MNKPNEGDWIDTTEIAKDFTDRISQNIETRNRNNVDKIITEFTILIGKMVENIEKLQQAIKEL